MSKFVFHAMKYKANGIRGMQIHLNRESRSPANPDIDPRRQGLNYDLSPWEKCVRFQERWDSIMAQGYTVKNKEGKPKPLRHDATVAVSFIVSSDADYFTKLSQEGTRIFFETAYTALSEYFGEKNVLSGSVHLDETTPHMHLAVVPLTEDGRLSAKELIDRDFLLMVQEELPEILHARGFRNLERGEKGSKRRHKSVQEFKKEFPGGSYKTQNRGISDGLRGPQQSYPRPDWGIER